MHRFTLPQISHDTKALVVLSGGQDSTVCLGIANHLHKEVHAITFDYGQRHKIEIQAAERIAELGADVHVVLAIPSYMLESTSPLTSSREPETYRTFSEMDKISSTGKIEDTFVPLRNTLFLTIACQHAVVNGLQFIYTGVCQDDNANYPDCTEAFIQSLQHTFDTSLGQPGPQIVTPLMHTSKAQAIKWAHTDPLTWAALAWSHTSYMGDYPPLHRNHATLLREQAFLDAGLPDPLILRAHTEGLMDLPSTSNYRG